MITRVSVVIVAQDEERTIGKVLSAVKSLAHEIILVDSGSTDKTIEIAKSYGAQYHHQDWLGYAAQKNYALSLATGDWILSLDADEVVTPMLMAEIKHELAQESAKDFDGFLVPRILYIGETPIMHGGFYPDAQLRLIQKGKGQFNDRLVHEAIKVEGSVKKLKQAMLHYAYPDVQGFAQAMEKYARLSAKEFSRRKVSKAKTSKVNETVHPLWTLFYRYVMRAGFLDGALGWQLNLIYSDYVRRKIRYLREFQNEV